MLEQGDLNLRYCSTPVIGRRLTCSLPRKGTLDTSAARYLMLGADLDGPAPVVDPSPNSRPVTGAGIPLDESETDSVLLDGSEGGFPMTGEAGGFLGTGEAGGLWRIGSGGIGLRIRLTGHTTHDHLVPGPGVLVPGVKQWKRRAIHDGRGFFSGVGGTGCHTGGCKLCCS